MLHKFIYTILYIYIFFLIDKKLKILYQFINKILNNIWYTQEDNKLIIQLVSLMFRLQHSNGDKYQLAIKLYNFGFISDHDLLCFYGMETFPGRF